jgi:hypothetical protein
MAKSDSFFIRAKVTTNSQTYTKVEIDLGSFVNLGVSKSTLLRIHNIAVQYADATEGPGSPIYSTTAVPNSMGWQLTTQDQTALVTADDKSLISSGAYVAIGDPNSTAHSISAHQVMDLNPQMWTQGYLVGVDSLFLGVDMSAADFASGQVDLSIVMECTLENATQANSVALALSQQ